MLTIEHLTKRFGDHIAVDGVSLAVNPGEIYALIGPNGSGKTTIVKTVAGLFAVNGGKVVVDGYDVSGDPVAAKRAIGYIPDDPAAFAGMTGEEFLHLTGALFSVPPALRAKKIPELLAIFGLAGTEKEPFESYSRGNKQKFSILAALLHEPKLLLIDEPIVGLDPESAKTAKRLFADFAERGGAVLLVTHTLPVAEEIASRIGLLKKGKIVAEGTLRELRARSHADTAAALEDVYQGLLAH